MTKLNQDDEKEGGLKKKRLEGLMKGRVTRDMKGRETNTECQT